MSRIRLRCLAISACDGGGTPFKGLIDEVQIYNHVPLDQRFPVAAHRHGHHQRWAGLCLRSPASLIGIRADGNAADSFGSSPGTAYGGVSYTPGPGGQAFSLNGNGSYVDLGTSADVVGSGPFSVSAWIKTTSDGVILQQRDAGVSNGEYQLAVSGGKVYWWSFSNGQYGFNFTSNASVNDGNWHLVTATRLANGTGQIYIDGVLDSRARRRLPPPWAVASTSTSAKTRPRRRDPRPAG